MDFFFAYDPLASGSKGLIYIGDKIIVYRRDNKTRTYPLQLDLPGGGPEINETPFETFRREVKEEFGLNITPEAIEYAQKYDSTLHIGKFGYFAVAKLPADAESNIVFGDEGTEWCLMEPTEFVARDDAWPMLQDRTQHYLDSLL